MKPFLNTDSLSCIDYNSSIVKKVHGILCDIPSHFTRFIVLFDINLVLPLQLSRTSVPFLKPETMTTSIPDYLKDIWRYCLHVKVRK
jgi:hypothetical protein